MNVHLSLKTEELVDFVVMSSTEEEVEAFLIEIIEELIGRPFYKLDKKKLNLCLDILKLK